MLGDIHTQNEMKGNWENIHVYCFNKKKWKEPWPYTNMHQKKNVLKSLLIVHYMIIWCWTGRRIIVWSGCRCLTWITSSATTVEGKAYPNLPLNPPPPSTLLITHTPLSLFPQILLIDRHEMPANRAGPMNLQPLHYAILMKFMLTRHLLGHATLFPLFQTNHTLPVISADLHRRQGFDRGLGGRGLPALAAQLSKQRIEARIALDHDHPLGEGVDEDDPVARGRRIAGIVIWVSRFSPGGGVSEAQDEGYEHGEVPVPGTDKPLQERGTRRRSRSLRFGSHYRQRKREREEKGKWNQGRRDWEGYKGLGIGRDWNVVEGSGSCVSPPFVIPSKFMLIIHIPWKRYSWADPLRITPP